MTNYITASSNLNITGSSDESTNANTVLLVPVYEGWRAVLSWKTTVDLDAYTKLPDGTIVYYKNKVSNDKVVSNDVDNRNGSGPETTTFNFTNSSSGTYQYYVNSYSKTQLNVSEATVTVYHGSSQVAQINAPNDVASLLYWNVFNINVVAGGAQTYAQVNKYVTGLN